VASFIDKAKDAATKSLEKSKEVAGKAKDKVDVLVEQNRDKLPDSVEKAYDKVSRKAEPHVPGEADHGTAEVADPSGTDAPTDDGPDITTP
jgi:hypothetical protein